MRRCLVLLGLCVSALGSVSCDDAGPGGSCGYDNMGTKHIDALVASSVQFTASADELDQAVREACNNINGDLGATTSTETQTACQNAKTAIEGVLADNSAVTITAVVEPAVCSVNATAYVGCAAECDANFDVEATPVTCTGGKLSVDCEGTCQGSCTVEAEAAVNCTAACEGTCSGSCTAEVSATCTGTCSGRCDGTCSATAADGTTCAGTCEGTCRGRCEGAITGQCRGTCSGTCTGSCTADMDVAASCEGRCEGTCTGTYSEPRCEGGEVNVEASAECQASCEGDASFEAECTEPQITYTYSGANVDDIDDLIATLEENLPKLLGALKKAELVVAAGVDFKNNLDCAARQAISVGANAVTRVTAAASAAVEASAKVTVSVSVSVEVAGSAQVGPEKR